MTEKKKEQVVMAAVVAGVILTIGIVRPEVLALLLFSTLWILGLVITLWIVVMVARWGGEVRTELRRIADALEVRSEHMHR